MGKTLVTCILLLLNLQFINAQDIKNRYKLNFIDNTFNLINVESEIYMDDDTLYMHSSCPNYDYPEGWSSFITDLYITNSGKKGELRYVGKSKWVVEGINVNNGEPLHLSYKVNLNYSKIKWDVGNEQSGFYDNNVLYTVTKALFIVNKKDVPSTVEFDIPAKWKISAPWKIQGENSYTVGSLEILIGNSIVIGEYEDFNVKSGEMAIDVVFLKNLKGEIKIVRSALEKILKSYLELFNDRRSENYMITIFHAEQDDGEAFKNSMAFTLKEVPGEDNKIIWANQLAHEIFHYWNGGLIKHSDYGKSRWFHEGFTEYYTTLTLIRNNIISEDMFYMHAQYMFGQYLFFKWLYPDTTLEEAGDKRAGVYRFGNYNGGWVAAFILDMMIRTVSNGNKSLDNFMMLMYTKFGAEPKPFSTEDIISVLNEVSPGEYAEFYNSYIKGSKVFPIEAYLHEVGLKSNFVDYKGEFYLHKIIDKNLAKKRASWLWISK